MPRIFTDDPASGAPRRVAFDKLTPGVETTLYECPDFSTPVTDDEDSDSIVTDPDTGFERQIVPGEALFVTPLNVSNNSAAPSKIRLWLQLENGTKLPYVNWVSVPANETIQIGINGLSLLKLGGPTSSLGDQLIAETEANSDLAVFAMLNEQVAPSHAPDTEEVV